MQISGATAATMAPVQAPDIAELTKVAVAADQANAATGTAAAAKGAIAIDPDPAKGGTVDAYA